MQLTSRLERLRDYIDRPAVRIGLVLFACVALACPATRGGEERLDVRCKYVREYHAQNTSIVCKKVDHAPKLDGPLNDPIWQQAGKNDSAFMLISNNEVCGRQTLVYLCYDTDALYVMYD